MSQRRRRVKQNRSLEERLGEQASQLKEQAARLPAGAERERLLRKARLADTGAHLSEWLGSPGLLPPNVSPHSMSIPFRRSCDFHF
nr:hypothetical protein [Bradyrhizobium sp. 62]